MYSDSSFLNVFGFRGPKIKRIRIRRDIDISQTMHQAGISILVTSLTTAAALYALLSKITGIKGLRIIAGTGSAANARKNLLSFRRKHPFIFFTNICQKWLSKSGMFGIPDTQMQRNRFNRLIKMTRYVSPGSKKTPGPVTKKCHKQLEIGGYWSKMGVRSKWSISEVLLHIVITH